MVFPYGLFKSSYSYGSNKMKYIRNIELIDAIQHLEMHLETAKIAKADQDFISGISRSIDVLKDLNKAIECEDEDDEE